MNVTLQELRATHTPALIAPEGSASRDMLNNVKEAERSVGGSKAILEAWIRGRLGGIWEATLHKHHIQDAGAQGLHRIMAEAPLFLFLDWEQPYTELFNSLWKNENPPKLEGSYTELCPPRDPHEYGLVTISDQFRAPLPLISIEDKYGLGVEFSGLEVAAVYGPRTFARRVGAMNRAWDQDPKGHNQEMIRTGLVYLSEQVKGMEFQPDRTAKYPIARS